MNILPGEPIPPGFEDEVNRSAEIQSTISNYIDNALIGVEYTVELVNEEEREPSYICLLCEKRGDPRSILAHWISFNHRMKYLEKHFPTAIRELAPVRYKPDSRHAMNHLITGICDAIEHHYGRLAVSVYHSEDFRSLRDRIIDEINNKYHYDEKNGPNFVNAIDREYLAKNTQILQITIKSNQTQKDRDSFDSISSDDEQQRKGSAPCGPKKKRKSQSPAYKVLPRVRRSPPFEESRTSDAKKSGNNVTLPTPKELSMQAFQIAQERYKWEKYRCMLEIAVKNLEKSLKDYEKNPEKHPLYPEEWKKFWNRRYKELQNEKKVDPNKYDYKPEWIVFWTKRMKELHADEIESKKKQIKVNLGLKEDAEEKTDMLKQKFKINTESNNSRLSKNASESDGKKKDSGSKPPLAVINISDDEDDEGKASKSKSKRNRGRSKSRSLSPLSDDYRDSDRRHSSYRSSLYERSRMSRPSHYSSRSAVDYYPSYHGGHYPPPPSYGSSYRVLDPYMYPQYDKQDNFPSSKGKSSKNEEKEEPEDDGPLTVVAVLRLLTALEEHLGSLGPKVVDLLGKALALEKVKANSSDEMLINEDNSVFFETIKEKLKGLLIADVLDDSQKVRAVKKAVKNIAAIIHQVNEKGKSSDSVGDESGGGGMKKIDDKPKNVKTSKPTIADLPFDRQIVSTKLAAALVMQGREDVSTGDMDKLIYLFILLVKLNKEKMQEDGKPLQMNNILPELGIAPQISPALVEEIIEHEVSAFVGEVDMDLEVSEKEANASSSASALESLTDSDLQTLLQNFKHLSTEEQHHLIAHLKKLETADPVRVEKLRKYVNLDTDAKETTTSAASGSDYKFSDSSKSKRSAGGESSPRSGRKDQFTDDETSRSSNVRKYIDDDDEDDDYNFEDVFKAVSGNVSRPSEERSQQSFTSRIQNIEVPDSTKTQQHSNLRQIPLQRPKMPKDDVPHATAAATLNPIDKEFKNSLNSVSIADTQNLIANLMGSLQQSCGHFNPSSSSDTDTSRSRNVKPSGNVNVAPVRNTQPASQSLTSVPFYQQQQQQQQPQQQQQQQQTQEQQMYTNFQNMQNAQSNFYPANFNNTVAYPNYNYNAAMQQQQPNMNGQASQMGQFNMQNFMPHVPNAQNYNMYGGNSGYK